MIYVSNIFGARQYWPLRPSLYVRTRIFSHFKLLFYYLMGEALSNFESLYSIAHLSWVQLSGPNCLRPHLTRTPQVPQVVLEVL